ncbi:DMT family transporter [Neptuniibacter sp. QD34_54]|uniref:DMT family transporter n=1 Tax=Neptuniibacter sp. QD34_54 TaxID=3398208 RepID=UPI0039F4EB32
MNSTSRTGLSALALVFATVSWGALFHIGKDALNYLDPYWFTAVRYILATVFVMALLLLTGKPRWEILRSNWPSLCLYGILGYGVFGTMVFVGLSLSVPSHGAIIMATIPITALLVSRFLDGQQADNSLWLVSTLAIIGVSLVSGVWSADSNSNASPILGDLIALIGTLGWVFYTRGQKKISDIRVLEYTAFTTLTAVPFIALFAGLLTVLGVSELPSTENLIASAPSMLFVVILSTVLAALAYNFGVKNLGMHNGILFINLVPVSAWLISTYRGIAPTSIETIGTLLVVAALLFQAYRIKNPLNIKSKLPSSPTGKTANANTNV